MINIITYILNNQKVIQLQIQVNFYGPLVKLTNVKKIELQFTKKTISLKELIKNLTQSFGFKFTKFLLDKDENEVKSFILILINDISVDLLEKLDTDLKNNDIITFLPSIHGG